MNAPECCVELGQLVRREKAVCVLVLSCEGALEMPARYPACLREAECDREGDGVKWHCKCCGEYEVFHSVSLVDVCPCAAARMARMSLSNPSSDVSVAFTASTAASRA